MNGRLPPEVNCGHMLKAEAKKAICAEFRNWCRNEGITNPDGNDVFVFYGGLDTANSPLLKFRDRSGDKYQTVHGWLLREGLVSD